MAEVGVRELRNGLSRWLALVQAGEEVTVTDRGRPVARIVPAATPAYDALVARGLVLRARSRPRDVPLHPPVVTSGPVSDLVADQRQ